MILLTSLGQELVLLSVPSPLNTWWWCIWGAAGSFSWYDTLLTILWDQAEFWAEVDKSAYVIGWKAGSVGRVEEEIFIFACTKPRTRGIDLQVKTRGEQVFLCLLTSEWDAHFEATLKSYFDNNPACTDRRISLGKCFRGWVLWGFFW